LTMDLINSPSAPDVNLSRLVRQLVRASQSGPAYDVLRASETVADDFPLRTATAMRGDTQIGALFRDRALSAALDHALSAHEMLGRPSSGLRNSI
jgi:hypothetical protein